MARQQVSILETKFVCNAAITQYTIMKFGADDHTVGPAAAATDSLIGVAQHATTASGEEVRVMQMGVSWVKAGGTITRGALVTSDASGQAVAAAPAAGTNNGIIGRAMMSGVSGENITVLLNLAGTQG